MLAKRSKAFGVAALCVAVLGGLPGLCASPANEKEAAKNTVKETAKEPTVDEIKAKRQSVREDLMLPSLAGIRGMSYVVIAPSGVEEYEKIVAEKLHELKVPVTSMRTITSGVKPIDGILELKVLKAGDTEHVALVQLNLIQWVDLLRDAKIKCKAVTYSENLTAKRGHISDAVSDVTNRFVISFLKANK